MLNLDKGKMQPCNLSYVPVASDDEAYVGISLTAIILPEPIIDAGIITVACDLADKNMDGEWSFTLPLASMFNAMLDNFRDGGGLLTENWDQIALAYAAGLEAEAARVRAKVGQEQYFIDEAVG